MLETRQRAGVSALRGLRKFTRAEAAALNAATAVFRDPRRWKPWVEEAFGELFQTSRGIRVTLTRQSTLSPEPEETYTFAQETVALGRSSENDIVLPSGATSRRHARLVLRAGELFVEDLGSAGGTHVGGQRLEPERPRRLSNGEEFLIFPYTFKVALEEAWVRDPEVAVGYAQARATTARAFRSLLGAGLCVFDLGVHPGAGTALLALTRPFLEAALARLTRDAAAGLAADDADLLHFVVLSVLARANRELRFPFECSLVPCGPPALGDEAGLLFEAALQLTGARGRLMLFVPCSVLSLAREAAPTPRFAGLRAAVRWKLPVRLGFVPLTVYDLQSMAPGDALLYTRRPELLLPGRGARAATERGWSLERAGESPERFAIDAFFERGDGMEEVQGVEERAESAGFEDLPVRVHVLLGEIEMSLAELEALKQGSIVELNSPPGSVQLVVNGKVLGTGELVEVEDRLGVEITRWGQV